VTETVEVRDAQGNLIGYFAPASPERADLNGVHIGPFTAADLPEIERRIAQSSPGRTTRQVFERLQRLTTDPAEQAYLQEKIDRLAQRDSCDSA
jgi:hypothetical protein